VRRRRRQRNSSRSISSRVQISPALQVQQQNAAAEQSADNGDTQDENADNNGDAQLRKRRIKAKRCRPTRRRNSRRQGFELRNSCCRNYSRDSNSYTTAWTAAGSS